MLRLLREARLERCFTKYLLPTECRSNFKLVSRGLRPEHTIP